MSTVDHRAFSDDLVAFIRAEVAVGDHPLEADTDLVLTGLVDSLGIVLVVDRILDMLRTAINVFGDSCAAVVIAKSEGEEGILE